MGGFMAFRHGISREQLALKISLIATLIMVALGISFGLLSGSSAILLDGFFSLFSTAMTGLGLITSYLVTRDEDRRFQFGYAYIEPLVTTLNGIAILLMCGFAIFYGVEAIWSGGHHVALAFALPYALLSSLLCWCCYAFMRRESRRTGSSLLEIDSHEWLVDGLLSSVVLAGFVVAQGLTWFGFESWVRFVDPILMLLLSSVALILPLRVLFRSLKDLLAMAPDDDFAQQLPCKLAVVKRQHELRGYRHYLSRSGRRYDLEVNFLVAQDCELSMAEQDFIRRRLWQDLQQQQSDLWLTVSFTANRRWL
ncbi:cation diffusion facilitator family transporter [Corallincola holothuriorum]|uniref:Cation diffusion facilitator family transporter n=3 Tax=Psychromonadaceae TaxID=267894 RepID=A0A368NP75_9GAMM|nr:cation diffusion facilitator family transporter [Corallincola holothuriorum]TAA47401.1 cation diffusion facilitator family transporter [Corallincola spongiicola]